MPTNDLPPILLFGQNVLVFRDPLPEGQSSLWSGVVVDLGPHTAHCQRNQRVLFPAGAGWEILHQGKTYQLLPCTALLGQLRAEITVGPPFTFEDTTRR